MTLRREGGPISRGVPSVKSPKRLTPPQADEAYFDKLAAFGVACVVAAVVGKLLLTSVSPKRSKGVDLFEGQQRR